MHRHALQHRTSTQARPPSRTPVIGALLAVLLAGGAGLPAAPAHAQQAPDVVEARVQDFLQAQSAGLPGEVTIQVSPLDPNNQLPACAALEPFLPAGTRAWANVSRIVTFE